MFVGRSVVSGLKIDTYDIVVVPPVPCDLAGLNPRDVGNARRLGKEFAQVACRDVLVCAHDKDTPRESARPLDTGDIIGCFSHYRLYIVISAVDGFCRVWGVLALERACAVGVIEIKAGVVVQIGFGNCHSDAVGIYRKRQEGETARIEPRQLFNGITVFKRVEELRLHVVVGACAHIGHCSRIVGREIEVGPLRDNFKGLGLYARKTVGKTVVIGTEFDAPSTLHAQG